MTSEDCPLVGGVTGQKDFMFVCVFCFFAARMGSFLCPGHSVPLYGRSRAESTKNRDRKSPRLSVSNVTSHTAAAAPVFFDRSQKESQPLVIFDRALKNCRDLEGEQGPKNHCDLFPWRQKSIAIAIAEKSRHLVHSLGDCWCPRVHRSLPSGLSFVQMHYPRQRYTSRSGPHSPAAHERPLHRRDSQCSMLVSRPL